MLINIFRKKIRNIQNIFATNIDIIFKFNKKISTAPIIKNAKGLLFSYSKNFFLSVIMRPKFSKEVNYLSFNNKKKKFGLIIQGNISEQKDFLIESLKIYKKIFKNVYIVISTWENEIDYLKDLKNLSNHIIVNQMPKNKGVANVNLQTTSTYNALKHLKKKKIQYCLKSRTDCRIYNPKTFIYLYNLLKTFPINKRYKKKLQNRILASSNYSCKYRLYGITDILLFSSTTELLNYFDKEFFHEGIKKIGVNNINYIKKNNYVTAESYLCAKFLNKIGIKIEWTMDNWEKMLKEIFCIFDASSVDFYWNKYEKIFEQRRSVNYSYYDNRGLTFADWFTIYSSKELILKPGYRERWKFVKNNLYKDSYF